jgi:ADP-heptose:LPS heptosyltransferase
VKACGLLPDDATLPAPSPRPVAPAPQAPVLIHPGAGSPRKRWPLERFRSVAAAVESAGGAVEYLLGPADLDLLPHLAGVSALHQPGDSLALRRRLQSARAYIGHDSGVSQLAAWLGLPCVAVFGPSDPVRWRPVGARVEVVRPLLTCTPCFETSPESCARPDCLMAVSPGDVLSALGRVAPGGIGGNDV